MQLTFQNDLTAFLRDSATGDLLVTATMLEGWLADGARDVIRVTPVQKLWASSTETSLANATGATITTQKILYVTRSDGDFDHPARRIPAAWESRARNREDTQFAVAVDPVYVLRDQLLKVIPDPTSAATAKIHTVSYPTPSATAITISGFEDDAELLVRQYMKIQAKYREMGQGRRQSQDEVEDIAAMLTQFETYATNASVALAAMNAQLDSATLMDNNWSSATGELASAVGMLTSASAAITASVGAGLSAINLAADRIAAQLASATALLVKTEASQIVSASIAVSDMDALLGESEDITSVAEAVGVAITNATTALGKVSSLITTASAYSASGAIELGAVFTQTTTGEFSGFSTAIADVQSDLDDAISVLSSATTDRDSVRSLLIGAAVGSTSSTPSGIEAINALNSDDIEQSGAMINIARARLEESAGVINAGGGKIAEAKAELDNIQAHIAPINAYYAGSSAKLQEASGYVGESAGYLQAAQVLLAEAQAKRQEAESRAKEGDANLKIGAQRLQNAGGYLQTAQGAVNEAQAFAQEVKSRLDQVNTYHQNAQARIANSNGYLGVVQSAINRADSYGKEAALRIQGAQSFLQEANSKTQTAGIYLQHSAQAKGEADTLQEKYEKDRDRYANG